MIHGMEVLKKTEILEKELTAKGIIMTFVLLGIALVVEIVAIVVAYYQRKEYCGTDACPAILFALGLALGFGGLFTLSKAEVEVPTGRYEYEVLISDTSTMKEVYEQYEVVGSKGEIYIIRDREVADNICSGCNTKMKDDNKFCPECGTKQ